MHWRKNKRVISSPIILMYRCDQQIPRRIDIRNLKTSSSQVLLYNKQNHATERGLKLWGYVAIFAIFMLGCYDVLSNAYREFPTNVRKYIRCYSRYVMVKKVSSKMLKQRFLLFVCFCFLFCFYAWVSSFTNFFFRYLVSNLLFVIILHFNM